MTTNSTAAAHKQKNQYDKNRVPWTFSVGEAIWLSVPTASKLLAQAGGELDSSRVKGPAAVNLKIIDDRRTRVIHTNRVWNYVQPQQHTEEVGATRDIARSQLVFPTDRLSGSTLCSRVRETLSTMKQIT